MDRQMSTGLRDVYVRGSVHVCVAVRSTHELSLGGGVFLETQVQSPKTSDEWAFNSTSKGWNYLDYNSNSRDSSTSTFF